MAKKGTMRWVFLAGKPFEYIALSYIFAHKCFILHFCGISVFKGKMFLNRICLYLMASFAIIFVSWDNLLL